MTDARGGPAPVPQSPARRAWSALRANRVGTVAATVLVVLYACAALAPFLAPYGEGEMDRVRFFHPPTPVRWDGRVDVTRPTAAGVNRYEAVPGASAPVRWFVRGAPYRLLGVIPADRHLFGVDAPARLYLFGADSMGRDVFSRLLYGAQVSLTVGLVGILISFTLGLVLGGVAGYLGGWVDTLVMRGAELFLSVPALYLVVALRAAFPAHLSSRQVYVAIVVVLAFVGWASLARVVRGMVLSLRRAEYVLAAEALGMSRARVLVRHILPNTASFVIVAATVAVPGYILGEVFLSFLGMGVQEPAASWGNMLGAARSVSVLRDHPWLLFAPGAAIFVTVMTFHVFGDALRDALDPRQGPGGRA
ncbi:MAG: ABC transporter permease [Candidatus Eisenbacteria bacterium]|uniref:ABC transporter permease n=1 Tax=Eiseniibacteriota bacterium TaxID=2212470 RepID=A0A933W8B6_UNCEI|nr:ABC transporter permease [Candidatus Eisenbacteria bacterium]